MFRSSGMTGTLVRRTFVAVQVFLLIAMLFAPLPAAAADPSADPGASAPPSAEPSATPDPTAEPTAEATADPTVEPSAEATTEPAAPTPPPTAEPTAQPTAEPPAPTPAPTATPTTEPLPAPIGSPTIGSDLEDYPPGGLVTLTGAHWAPGESVHIFVNDDWGSSWSRNVDVVADASGTIVDQFNLPNWFVAVYSVAATGSSGSMARATFTDSNPSAVTVGSPTSRTVVQGGTATFGTLTVAAGGNGSACDTTLSIIVGTGTGLPSGVTGNFGANPVTTTGGNASTTFSVTTTSSTPPGTYTFQVSGVDSQPPGGACQGGATNTPSVLLTLTVTAGTVATSTALSSSSNPSIYGGSVTFTATVTGSSSPNNAGTVTFKDGSSVICLNVPLAAGAAGCTTSALTVTAAPHSMTAEYSGSTGFTASTSPAILQAITPKDVVITPHASQAKVYGTSDPTLTFTNNGGLAAGAFSGSLGRAAGDDVGSYAISLGSLSAGSNYNLTMASATVHFAITAAPLTVDFVAAGKVYDTTTAASITSCSVGPVLGLDEVTCDASLATASFAGAAAGSHTVSGSGFGLAGADAANYEITLTHTTSATIGQAASTTTVDCTAGAPFTYSGDPITPCTATASGAGMSPLDVTGSLVYTANTDAGSASAEASWAGDLNHSASTGSGAFSIGQAASTVTVTCPVSVVYNAAAQSPCEVSVTGAGGLDLSPDATYAMNTDVGTASAAYTFPGDANHIGSFGSDTFAITAAPLTVDFVAAGKVYDTTTAATITSCSVGPVLGLDEVTCDASLATASFAGAAAGSHTVSGSGFGLAGADAGNYEIVGVDPTSAEITKAPSTVTVDCTAGAPFTFSGVAQTPCTAQATGIGLSPVDVTTSIVYADNLHAGTASADATWTGDVNHDGDTGSSTFEIGRAASITSLAFEAGPYVYRGTPFTATAHVSGVGGLSESVAVGYSGDCTNVTVGGCSATATFAGDGDHTGSADTQSIAITRKPVTGSFTAADKVWDGFTAAVVDTTTVVGKVSGDDVALTGGSASFSSNMVGTWTVTLSGAALSGSTAGNYQLGSVATTTATIGTAFRIVGFDSPVDMTRPGQERNYNSVKNGQTVPLKFRVFNLDGSEVVATTGLTAWARSVSCATGDVDPTLLPIVSTADTGLRRTGDRFHFNWFVPKGAGKCYQVLIQTVDGSTVLVGDVSGTPVVEAYFRSK